MNQENISITIKNFGKKNELVLLLFNGVFLILGLLSLFLNWRNAIAIILIFVLIFLDKKFRTKFSILIIIYIVSIILISQIPEIEFVEILATSILFSPLFFYESSLESIKNYQKDDAFEVFYLDSFRLKCLHTEDNDYKSYALNPKQFLKTFRVNDINSFVFQDNFFLILTSKFIIRPRELNAQNIEKIKKFIEENFPDKLNLESEHHKALKNESEMYLSKLLLVLPLILVFLVIYFFGDNGRNHLVTYTSIAVILLFYIFLIIKIKHKK
ncbi:hypothetical protein [Epilithonimonas xixisoli]|uniref:YcxB-like protein n=1 Tax=Epilithonimonas xixisoli TaxID=1476462 RepID=A0A4R8IDF0_9FLAO|nr:hypothetical protein [Epilithonimonas xixisoli]TDX86446.1 hypothetical protein B0I22_0571 [Epilithonimonas xixisoli]